MIRTCLSSAVAASLLLAACAGGPDAAQAPQAAGAAQNLDALPPQQLAPGACGLFLFELREPNSFLVFENETSRRVRLLSDGRVAELGVPPQSAAMVPGDRFRRVYLDQARNVTYTLTGRVGEDTGSGQRLEDVILRERALDGTETVTPLGGVRRCAPRAPVGG